MEILIRAVLLCMVRFYIWVGLASVCILSWAWLSACPFWISNCPENAAWEYNFQPWHCLVRVRYRYLPRHGERQSPVNGIKVLYFISKPGKLLTHSKIWSINRLIWLKIWTPQFGYCWYQWHYCKLACRRLALLKMDWQPEKGKW